MTYSLVSRAAIITGAARGFGLAIARAYVKAGASVLLCDRDAQPLEQAHSELAALASLGQKVIAQAADVSRCAEVEKIAATAFEAFPHIHVLVSNAGVYGPKGLIEEVDWEEWVRAIEINLLGPVLMCRAVLPHFKTHRYGKIVQIAGGGATSPYPRLSAYGASKAGVVRFAESLAEEVRSDHIDVNAVSPGALNTRFLDELLEAGPQKIGQALYEQSLKQKETGGTPFEKGVTLAVFLGSAASDGITGKLISAVWDPWETLAAHLEELRGTDIYTLRRIVPKDRGAAWS